MNKKQIVVTAELLTRTIKSVPSNIFQCLETIIAPTRGRTFSEIKNFVHLKLLSVIGNRDRFTMRWDDRWKTNPGYIYTWGFTWWRHQMETFSALLAICAGNSPVTGKFPALCQWGGALMFSLICAWMNGWANNREDGDLRCHRTHYDVIVMSTAVIVWYVHNALPSMQAAKHVYRLSKLQLLETYESFQSPSEPIPNVETSSYPLIIRHDLYQNSVLQNCVSCLNLETFTLDVRYGNVFSEGGSDNRDMFT